MNNASSPAPVVVAIDGSSAAIAAAEWAAREALHQEAPLRLVHVIPEAGQSTASTAIDRLKPQYAETCLREACLAVKATGLPIEIDTAVLRGDVASALVGESENATIICVGSVGVGRVAAAVLGSTVRTLTESARCPVAVIRCNHDEPYSDTGYITVLLEGNPEDEAAMLWAMEEARVRHAPVMALGVFPWPLFDVDDERFYRRLDRWLRRYPDVTVEIATTRLSPSRYLEGFVGAVQLIVVGRGEAHNVTRLLGPHNLSIFAHADCSILIARPVGQADHNEHQRLLAAEGSTL